MTIIFTTVGKNPLEEMEQPSQSTKAQKVVLVDAISKNNKIILANIIIPGGYLSVILDQCLETQISPIFLLTFCNIIPSLRIKRGLMFRTSSFYHLCEFNKWVNLTQITVISTPVSKNPLEEMEQPSQSTKQSKMQYLDAISKMTE